MLVKITESTITNRAGRLPRRMLMKTTRRRQAAATKKMAREVPWLSGALTRAPAVLQDFIERMGQALAALVELAGDGVVLAFQHVVLVRDVERGQYGQAQRVHR